MLLQRPVMLFRVWFALHFLRHLPFTNSSFGLEQFVITFVWVGFSGDGFLKLHGISGITTFSISLLISLFVISKYSMSSGVSNVYIKVSI